jgi:hypothetical protein
VTATVERAPGSIRKKQIKKATLEIIFQEGLKRLSTKNLADKCFIWYHVCYRIQKKRKFKIIEII